MEIIRYVSDYDMALFNKRAIDISRLIIRSITDEINPDAKEQSRINIARKTIPIKIIIPDIDKECK